MFEKGLYISGTKVEVVDAGFSIYSGSEGYIIGMSSNPNNGIVHQTLLITRRGKSGQARLELKRITTPVFYFKSTDKKEDEYYNCLGGIGHRFIRITAVEQPTNLLELPTLEFVAWCSAKLINMSAQQANNIDVKGQFWKELKGGRLEALKRLPGRFSKHYPATREQYDDVANRIDTLAKIRYAQAKIFRMSKMAEHRKHRMYADAISYLTRIKRDNKYKFSSFNELKKLYSDLIKESVNV